MVVSLTWFCTHIAQGITKEITILWSISPDADADQIQSQNAALVQTLNADMPKFHSREM